MVIFLVGQNIRVQLKLTPYILLLLSDDGGHLRRIVAYRFFEVFFRYFLLYLLLALLDVGLEVPALLGGQRVQVELKVLTGSLSLLALNKP